jgi:gliding-associated putative ABC transporter substrate-binding component GldG
LNDAILNSFKDSSIIPVNVTVNDKGQQTQEVVFPWAVATCGNRSVKVPLLKNMMGASTAEKVVSSVQHLEYAFANAFNTVSKTKQKKVAVMQGNGELGDVYIADFIKSVKDNYYIGPFTLDSVAKSPNESLKYLKKYDLAIIIWCFFTSSPSSATAFKVPPKARLRGVTKNERPVFAQDEYLSS